MSLRPGRFEYKRLAWALAISLAVHLFCYGGYEFTRRVLPDLLERMKILAALAEKLRPHKATPPPQPTPPPLVFVDVNPEAATPEPPKNAQYYSSHNSRAANPDSQLDSNTPKINGQQTHVVKTEDTTRKSSDQLQPDFKALQKQLAEESKPKPPPGDLAMAKPDTQLREESKPPVHVRPRTLSQVAELAGQQMKQEGGVSRRLKMSSLDAKATPFGAYDAAFIAAVQQRWYDLLDSNNFSFGRHGHVVLQFHLNYDGSITDMKVAEDTADSSLDGVMGIICERAVQDPAPFDKWPREMRLLVEKDYREIQFSFFYD
jgi:hypothetical protein